MAERYQREIEEILAEAGEEAPRRQAPRGRTTGARPLRPSPPQRRGFSPRPTPGRLAFAGVASFAVALALNLIGAPGASVLLWVGVALFVAAYVSYFTAPRRTTERRWRGEALDAPPPPGPLARLWRRGKEIAMGKLIVGVLILALVFGGGWFAGVGAWVSNAAGDVVDGISDAVQSDDVEDATSRAQPRCRTEECRRLITALERDCLDQSIASDIEAFQAYGAFRGVRLSSEDDYLHDLDIVERYENCAS